MLMMIPTLYTSEQKKPWWLFGVTVVLSSITAYLGFIHDVGWAIIATLGIICLARIVVDIRAMLEFKESS